jgi:hypothetical protein
MFGIFQSKEKKLAKHMAESLKEIDSAGGALVVCEKFGDWIVGNELFEALGVCSESLSPFNQSLLMLAAISLLAEVKKSVGERFSDEYFLEEAGLTANMMYAKTTYIASALLVDDKQLLEIINACKAGEPPPAKLLAPYFERKAQHEKSWQEYVESDYDFSSEAMLNKLQS